MKVYVMLEELNNFFGRFESVLIVVKFVNVKVDLVVDDVSLLVVSIGNVRFIV